MFARNTGASLCRERFRDFRGQNANLLVCLSEQDGCEEIGAREAVFES
jgi:hypothetical protein